MIYLLDANVLIEANHSYYPLERVEEFWEWIVHIGNSGLVKIPIEIFEEIQAGDDGLAKWAKNHEVKSALLLNEEISPSSVSQVIENGYGNNLNDIEIEKLGRDPFLIAYAYNNGERCIVTTEAPKPSRKGANRHIPDVCGSFGITWCNSFSFYKALNFNTKWKNNY